MKKKSEDFYKVIEKDLLILDLKMQAKNYNGGINCPLLDFIKKNTIEDLYKYAEEQLASAYNHFLAHTVYQNKSEEEISRLFPSFLENLVK